MVADLLGVVVGQSGQCLATQREQQDEPEEQAEGVVVQKSTHGGSSGQHRQGTEIGQAGRDQDGVGRGDQSHGRSSSGDSAVVGSRTLLSTAGAMIFQPSGNCERKIVSSSVTTKALRPSRSTFWIVAGVGRSSARTAAAQGCDSVSARVFAVCGDSRRRRGSRPDQPRPG